MYFPDDMNFQYFFFSTYPGFFLQALPVALVAGAVFAVRRARSAPGSSAGKLALPSLFICYIAGLACLTLFNDILGILYYFLFYRMPSGRRIHWFNLEYDLVPDFFLRFGSENLGNIVMFLPFGVLYPLYNEQAGWRRTVLTGVAVSVGIELLQPVFGRSFDVNDIILNGLGVILSATAYFALRVVPRRGR